jgi:hypothetical protein
MDVTIFSQKRKSGKGFGAYYILILIVILL